MILNVKLSAINYPISRQHLLTGIATIISTVLCDSGDVVLVGGYNINSPDGSGIFILNTGASSTGNSV